MGVTRFSSAQLDGDQIVVSGPLQVDPSGDGDVRSLRFVLVQGDAVVDGAGEPGEGSWTGRVPAAGFEPGAVQGFRAAREARARRLRPGAHLVRAAHALVGRRVDFSAAASTVRP
jgi:hypothetical protein